jgi:tetratricopeptide (TPR) repeat protein
MGLANSLLTRFGNKISGVWKYFQPTPEREDPPNQDLSTDSVTNLWDEDLVTDEVETYQSLIRGIRRTSGFRLFFVCCSRSKGAELIAKLAVDLPQRKFATLSITEPIDNLYNRIEELPNLAQIDTLFIQGLEHSIFEYEDREFGDINLRSTTKVYSGTTVGVPPLFAHLNMQRERFRDDFSICFVFLLPDFALNYFVRRAPDFFDWRSQSFRFFTDKKIVDRASLMVRIEGDVDRYPEWTPEKRRDAILKIKECLDESIDPDEQYSLSIKLGNILFADRRYENAIAAYDKALAIKPDEPDAWNNRGNALYQIGRTEEAIASYDKALAIKPDDHEAWNNRGNALLQIGRTEEAIAAYDKALAIKPDDHEAWNNRGVALLQIGRTEEAIAAYDKALAIKPDDHQAWNNRGNALGQIGRTEEAIAAYDKALAIKPDKHEAWNNRGVALRQIGRNEEAIAAYDKALAIKPDLHEAWNNRGIALGQIGRTEEAIAAFDKALAIKPDDHEVIYNKACIYALQQQIDLALQYLQQAIQLKSEYYREMARTDSDFDPIRDNARFQALIADS